VSRKEFQQVRRCGLLKRRMRPLIGSSLQCGSRASAARGRQVRRIAEIDGGDDRDAPTEHCFGTRFASPYRLAPTLRRGIGAKIVSRMS